MAFVPFKEFGIMRNLRTVGIAKTQGKILNIPGKHLENFHPNELSNSFDIKDCNQISIYTFDLFTYSIRGYF